MWKKWDGEREWDYPAQSPSSRELEIPPTIIRRVSRRYLTYEILEVANSCRPWRPPVNWNDFRAGGHHQNANFAARLIFGDGTVVSVRVYPSHPASAPYAKSSSRRISLGISRFASENRISHRVYFSYRSGGRTRRTRSAFESCHRARCFCESLKLKTRRPLRDGNLYRTAAPKSFVGVSLWFP